MVNGSLHVDPSKTHGVTSFIWASEEEVIFFIDFENGQLHSLRDERTINNFTFAPLEEFAQGQLPKFEIEQSDATTSVLPGDGASVYERKAQADTDSSEPGFSLSVLVAGLQLWVLQRRLS
jgi:hypothetical protein